MSNWHTTPDSLDKPIAKHRRPRSSQNGGARWKHGQATKTAQHPKPVTLPKPPWARGQK